ncbi:hypothetical protein B566_EDAN012800 [Ephemera danica]|nr:hypothetical protein B566_EDAN012800 [Ephemera danica]
MNQCKDMHFLNLAGNTLGVEAAKEIGKALEIHKELKRALDDEDDAESEEEEEEDEGSEKEDGELSQSGDSSPPTPAKPKQSTAVTPAKPSMASPNLKSPAAEVITLPDTPERPAGDNLEPEEKVKGGVALLMAVSSAAATRRPEVHEAASETGVVLYTKLFKWAEASDHLNLLNNELLAEEKNCFASVPWDLEGCMLVLEQFCSKNPLPSTIRDSLQLLLSRPHIAVNNYPESKRKLLAALFKY